MKIEILYPEVANLFGDMSNMKYLRQCLPEAEFIETSLQTEPAFVRERVDMIYLGAMSESGQRRVINHLMPHVEMLKQRMEDGVVMLATGNAMEVFFQSINFKGEPPVEGLAIFDFMANGNFRGRYNGLVLGTFEGIELIGFKTQFTRAHGDNAENAFFKVERGMGMHERNPMEGLHVHNFFGTYLVGPFLMLNPLFTEYLLKLLGVENPQLAFREEVVAAYEKRLTEFHDSNVAFEY